MLVLFPLDKATFLHFFYIWDEINVSLALKSHGVLLLVITTTQALSKDKLL
jgi:hypothetical protein